MTKEQFEKAKPLIGKMVELRSDIQELTKILSQDFLPKEIELRWEKSITDKAYVKLPSNIAKSVLRIIESECKCLLAEAEKEFMEL